MPRYSCVVLFPILIALCIGINIYRYPAVSAMLQGESVEARWLGRSHVFNFKDNSLSGSISYQGYRLETGDTADTRASREPIALSDIPSSQSDSTGTSSSPSISYGSYGSSHSDDASNSRSYGSGNTDSTAPSSSSSDWSRNSHGSDFYSANSTPQWDSYSYGTDRTDDRNINNTERSESRSFSNDRSSRLEYPNDSKRENGSSDSGMFRMDTPVPGYSSRYTTDETASTTAAAESDMETEPASPHTRRFLSLQDKLELRLATPFSLTPTNSQESSDQYIPPDFLPPHENGVVGKLSIPSDDQTVTLTPIIFNSAAPPSIMPDTETTEIPETETLHYLQPAT